MKLKVLFLCATNGVYSPMAEGLLTRVDSQHFEASSAAIGPEHMHPMTVEVMKEINIDLDGKQPVSMEQMLGQQFDFVISMSDQQLSASTISTNFPKAEYVRWHFDDPTVTLGPEKQKHAFQAVRDQIAQRINLFMLVQSRPSDSAQFSHVG